MSDFIKCPVQEIELRVIGKDKEYTLDEVTNYGSINLDHIETVGIEEMEIEKELADGIMAVFSFYSVILIPVQYSNTVETPEPHIWLMPDRASAYLFETAFVKGAKSVNKHNIKGSVVYGVVEDTNEETS